MSRGSVRDDVPAAVRAFLETEGIGTGTPVLAAFSGGADSTAMLLALQALGVPVTAVHVHHGLRGAEADRDAAFCGDLCARRGIPFVLRRVNVRENPNGRGVEGAARALRYAALEQTARERDIRYIAAAHNAGDALETALFNLARGTGVRGLGIPPVRTLPGGAVLIRPVLRLTRDALRAYLADLGESYVEDSTNAEEDAARNILRLNAVPALLRVNPRAVEHALAAFDRLREDDALLNAQAEALLDAEGACASAKALREAPRPLAARAVRLLYGGDDLEQRHIEAVLALCESSRGHAAADLPRQRAVREYDALRMVPRTAVKAAPDLTPVRLLPGGSVEWAGMRISVRKTEKTGQVSAGVHKITVDSCAIHGILIVRGRRTGDVFRAAGRSGTKTLKKAMIEAGIPASARAAAPVFESDGRICAVWGLGTAEGFAPRSDESAWEITAEPVRSGI